MIFYLKPKLYVLRLRVNYNNIHRCSTLISWNLPDWNGKCMRPTGPAPIRLSTLTLPWRECNPPPKRPALAQNGRPGGLAAVKPVLRQNVHAWRRFAVDRLSTIGLPFIVILLFIKFKYYNITTSHVKFVFHNCRVFTVFPRNMLNSTS